MESRFLITFAGIMRRVAALLFRSFLKGLIILGPLAITAYVIWLIFTKVDKLLLIKGLPAGFGFVIIISSVTIIGFFGSRSFIGKAIVDFFDHLLERVPGIRHIYSPVKDVMDSFVGDKKRFNQPVWLRTANEPELWRIGFLTQPDMGYLGMEGKVAVYLPHSYAISGWVVVADRKNVVPVSTMNAAEAMKFAVSGGITLSQENAEIHAQQSK